MKLVSSIMLFYILCLFICNAVRAQINELQEEPIVTLWEQNGQGHVFKHLDKLNSTERANLFHQLQVNFT